MGGNSIGDIFLNLKLNSSGFDKQVKGMKGVASKAAKVIGAAFTVKALANFSKQCIDLGSDLQEVQNVVDTTFSSMSGKVNQFAKDAAQSYGLSETMAKKYVGTYGAMAKAFGYSESEAYKMSSALTGLTGDVASFYNLSQDEAYTKLKSVFTGETESLKDLGVVMTQSALDQYALANGFGKTTAAMTEQEKVSLRYAFVQKQLSAAAGDFIRTQDSWANQTRVLSLQVESFKAAIGQGLINILTPVIKVINTLMSKLVAAANAFKSFTETLFGKQDAGTKNNVDEAAESTGNVTDAANTATEATKKLKRELAGFDQITKLGSDDSSSDASNPSTTGGTTTTPTEGPSSGDDVSTLATKYERLTTAIGNLKLKFEGFTTLLSSAGKWVYDNVLKPLGEWTMDKLLPGVIDALAAAFEFLTTALGFLKPAWDWIWQYLFKPIANFVGDAILIWLEKIKGFFELLTTALQVLKPVWDWIWKNFFEPIGKFVGTAITEFLKGFTEQMSLAPAGIELLKGAIASIPGKIEEIKGNVKKKWDELKSNITDKTAAFKANIATKWSELKEKWNTLKSNIKAVTADFKAKIATKWSELKEKWSSITSNIKTKTANMKAKVATTWSDLKGKWNSLIGNLKDKTVTITAKLKDNITTAIKTMWNGIATGINSAINTINKIPGVNIKKLPMLAQGGYVKKNTPQLAMIGDNRHYGEIVAPENKLEEMARMAAAGAGGTSPEVVSLLREIVALLKALDLDVTIDGKSLMQMIVRLINNQTKNTGKCPITI